MNIFKKLIGKKDNQVKDMSKKAADKGSLKEKVEETKKTADSLPVAEKKAKPLKLAVKGKKQGKVGSEKSKDDKPSQEVKQVLIKPLLTEKATYLKSFNKYVFEVHPRVNKIEIKREIKKIYKVDPVSVNIVRVKGKRVRFGRTSGVTKGWKKAIITLKQGQSINLS